MKRKREITMRTIFTLLTTTFLLNMTCHALPLGNPGDATLLWDGLFHEKECSDRWLNKFNFRFGFYGDYVFDRHFKVDLPSSPPVKKAELYTNAGYLAWNYQNRLDLFATFGTSDLTVFIDEFITIPVGALVEIKTNRSFSWSLGGRWSVAQLCGFLLGVEGQYFRFEGNLDSISIAGVRLEIPLLQQIVTDFDEWQVGVGIAYRSGIAACGKTALVPYFGYTYSRATFEFPDQDLASNGLTISGGGKLPSDRHSGYAVGVTLVGCDKMAFTVEARFAAERAFHVNGQLQF